MRARLRPTRGFRLTAAAALVAFAHALVSCDGMLPAPAPAAPRASAPLPPPPRIRHTEIAHASLSAARELDQQGVRAFAEGRYREASRYFDEAHKRGGPSIEIWNMARCLQKLDDLEMAAQLIEDFLDQKDLSPADRDEARRELAEIMKKPSRVTAISKPPGALVYAYPNERRGALLGRTPCTFELPPGEHLLLFELGGKDRDTERVSAHFGRAVVVDVGF